MIERRKTRQLHVGSVAVGGDAPIAVQSMTNTHTDDAAATLEQIQRLADAGCDIIRCAVPDMAAAEGLKTICKESPVPIIADIHFDYHLALACIEAGADKIRLNPGNIGARENVEKVVKACKEKHIPIRIGINGGSLEKDIHEKYGKPTAQGMIESAKRHVQILEDLDFYDTVLSFKSSDPLLCIEAYRLAAQTFDYPLHLGVTEAGTTMTSAIKSSLALGTLLNEGIGNTIRISVNGAPEKEIPIVKELLKDCKLIQNVPNLIACPTCGRTQWDMEPAVNEIESYLQTVNKDVTVAIMGCAVNGPGEAKHADIAIAGGKKEGLLIKKGKIIEKIPQDKIVARLKEEIDKF